MGDHVFLKVMPKRGVVKFGKGKAIVEIYHALRGTREGRYGWRYRQNYLVFMRYSMSPCSGSILKIQLMWWIRESLLLMQMEPSRRDWYVSWIAGNKFCEARP